MVLQALCLESMKMQSATKLIDKVTTNENGYAVSTNVGAGDYWVKELVAPTGYSLNDQTYMNYGRLDNCNDNCNRNRNRQNLYN